MSAAVGDKEEKEIRSEIVLASNKAAGIDLGGVLRMTPDCRGCVLQPRVSQAFRKIKL